MPDYRKELNAAQHAAVTSPPGHTLVVAGAGTGKTRTITYRLAWLAEQGVPPEEILLLTFTRKAAHEMLARAEKLLGRRLQNLPGGTFHSFAFSVLRIHKPGWLNGRNFTLMDAADISQLIRECREQILAGKKDPHFPKSQTIAGLISKARNKELSLTELVRGDSCHLLQYAPQLEELAAAYAACKRERGVLDYDDMLFELEALLAQGGDAARAVRRRFSHILVDEYQDTNAVQARIVRLLAQPAPGREQGAHVMAVGDEAQSIYAFRGANVRNIMDFPTLFPGAKIVRLEQNYRSTQPILDIANGILSGAAQSYKKQLFTTRKDGELPGLIRPASDACEAEAVADRIENLLREHRPHEIAVLFRSGFHSYALENALRKRGLPFRKYGGLRFVEAAHVKDLLAYARLAINPWDYPAFARLALMHKGIGPKTMARLHSALVGGNADEIARALRRFPDLREDLALIEQLVCSSPSPREFFEAVLVNYRMRLEDLYPDDWPSRQEALQEILRLAETYESLDVFVADLALEPDGEEDVRAEEFLTLSTIHSAKGLEWNAVLILDVVEDRFPSRHSQARPEDFEEERRLFYVACTRARQSLDIYAPAALYSYNGGGPVALSPFLRELPQALFKVSGKRPGACLIKQSGPAELDAAEPAGSGVFAAGGAPLRESRYCRHRIFGKGKIIKFLDDERVQVNFPGMGLKVILADYLMPEEG
ncbi:MAG: ATP-dependent helicase [Desulfovibrio sp.]|nr:ATP-dependent helicase [Desulfovibrio sp.]